MYAKTFLRVAVLFVISLALTGVFSCTGECDKSFVCAENASNETEESPAAYDATGECSLEEVTGEKLSRRETKASAYKSMDEKESAPLKSTGYDGTSQPVVAPGRSAASQKAETLTASIPAKELADSRARHLSKSKGGAERPAEEPMPEVERVLPRDSHGRTASNPFVETSKDNLSTFAVDVDTASYTYARKFLQQGQLPPKGAVRVEEFVNYFKYYYKSPEKDTFAIYVEGAPSRFGDESLKLLKIGIKGKEIAKEARKDALLTFVIDVSGSMRENGKLENAKKALACLVEQMREGDQIAIITYNTNARILLEPVSGEKKDTIIRAIQGLYPGGSTNAQAGLRLGYEMAMNHFEKKCVNRIIFCSDGVANVGNTGAQAILNDVKTSDTCGIYLTAIGFGVNNYNDELLEKLADKGDGSYHHIDTLKEAKRVFVEELAGTLQVIAKDVKIQVEFDKENVKKYRLLGYENRAVADNRFRDDTVDAGEVGAGHSVTALYEVEPQENSSGRLGAVHVRYKDPESDKVTEIKCDLRVSDISENFYESSENFRLAALAAEFAEVLRESPFAVKSRLSSIHGLVRKVALDFDNREDVLEFASLVAAAARIKGEEINEEIEEPSPDGVRTGWSRPSGEGRREDLPLGRVLPLFLLAFAITITRVAYIHGFRRQI